MLKYPEYLWLLLVLIPVVFAMVYTGRNSRNFLRISYGQYSTNLVQTYRLISFFRYLSVFLFIVFAVLAMTDISWGTVPEKDEPLGAELVYVVDISRSMTAADVEPSRLEKTAQVIRVMSEKMPVDRQSLVVFKGEGVNIVPMTEDTTRIRHVAESLSPGILTAPGTNLEKGIRTGLRAFTRNTDSQKFLFLFSDGEGLDGDIPLAEEALVNSSVTVFTIGIGTRDGAFIPDGEGGRVVDSSGEPVVTRLNDHVLRSMAETTGGEYYSILEQGITSVIIATCSDQIRERLSKGYILVSNSRYMLFLSLAIAMIMLYLVLRVIPWKDLY